MTPDWNRLDEMVLMMGHKIRFYEEIWLIIPKLSLLPLLIWSTDVYGVCGITHLSPNAYVFQHVLQFC